MQQILVLRVRFIAAKDHIKKKKNFKAITLQLEKEQTKPKAVRRKEIMIRAEIDETETKKTLEKISEAKDWFFEKINM